MCETLPSPSILNTGNSKNNCNETEIISAFTSLGSVNCDTQPHALRNPVGRHRRLYAEFQVASDVCPGQSEQMWTYAELANTNTKLAAVTSFCSLSKDGFVASSKASSPQSVI
jgi:hypothetical protein